MEKRQSPVRRTIDGRELTFVRRASDGRTLSEKQLAALELTNDTITRVVSAVTGRLAAERPYGSAACGPETASADYRRLSPQEL